MTVKLLFNRVEYYNNLNVALFTAKRLSALLQIIITRKSMLKAEAAITGSVPTLLICLLVSYSDVPSRLTAKDGGRE
ncbi:hypothetical protein TNIN_219771 [Trichonephila inaurata madagascariensis]|uniref:Uncharacterized protein n=1 Tax=Trichonephila inaurata madagascariensis TaxID=2747483 RepID=A0A8X7C728_9ARAC|nr:hypothetical protein TNIN_219771 [Trichonephila inaurata madagascariensis]